MGTLLGCLWEKESLKIDWWGWPGCCPANLPAENRLKVRRCGWQSHPTIERLAATRIALGKCTEFVEVWA